MVITTAKSLVSSRTSPLTGTPRQVTLSPMALTTQITLEQITVSRLLKKIKYLSQKPEQILA